MSKDTTSNQREHHREIQRCQGKIGEIQTENYETRTRKFMDRTSLNRPVINTLNLNDKLEKS